MNRGEIKHNMNLLHSENQWQYNIPHKPTFPLLPHTLLYLVMVVLVDATIHGDGYITPIVIVCKLCK